MRYNFTDENSINVRILRYNDEKIGHFVWMSWIEAF